MRKRTSRDNHGLAATANLSALRDTMRSTLLSICQQCAASRARRYCQPVHTASDTVQPPQGWARRVAVTPRYSGVVVSRETSAQLWEERPDSTALGGASGQHSSGRGVRTVQLWEGRPDSTALGGVSGQHSSGRSVCL